VEQGWLGAINDAPLGFAFEQLLNGVVDHRVIGPAPLDGRVLAEQAADAGVGRLHGAVLVAQQVDHQHIGLGHQRLQRWLDGINELFIGIEHQHPIAAHKFQGFVACWREIAGPFDLFHPRAGFLGDGDGVVGGTGVDHHQLIAKPFDALEACAELLLFIAHDHREAEHGRWLLNRPRG